MAIHKKYTIRGTPDASMVDYIDEMLEDLYRGLNTDPLLRSDILPVDLGDADDVIGTLPFANLEELADQRLLGNASGGSAVPSALTVSSDFTLTGGALALTGAVAGAWSRVTKLGDTSRTTNAVLSADPDLSFAIVASKTYIVRGRIWLTADATPDFKFRFTGPASPTLVLGDRSYLASAQGAGNYTRTNNYQTAAFDSADTVINGAGAGGTSRSLIEFNYTIDNGANAGTFAFEWAQNTSDAGACKVHKGSWMEYKQIN